MRPGSQSAERELLVGRYEVLERLGDGPAGTTYLVRHPLLDVRLSVTVLSADMAPDPDQFAALACAIRDTFALRHEHIVPVLDLVEEGTRYHLVEGLAVGEPLDRALAEGGPLPAGDALRVAGQLAAALAYAHEHGMVHGALTPTQVRLARGATPCAMLGGFASVPRLAAVPYAAPEQLAGERADARTDVFALGLVLFEMLEGRPFFTGGEEEVRELLLRGSEPLLPQFSALVPGGVSGLVGRATRRSPAHRPQTMARMRSEIDACLRRLGERAAEMSAPVVADETSESLLPEAEPPAQQTSVSPPRRRLAVKLEAPVRESGIPPRILLRPPARAAASGRALVLGGAILVGAFGLGVVRMVPHGSSTPAIRVVTPPEETSAGAVDVPAPVAEMPAADTRAEVPPAPAPVSDTVASVPEPEAARPEPAHEPLRIVGRSPRAGVTVSEGATLAFGVRTSGGAGSPAYAWLLDGRRMGGGPRWRFVAPPAAAGASHRVEVQVSDAAGGEAPHVAWTVAVTPRMSESDVRDWLGRLASAWERRDLASLRLYGVFTRDEEAEEIRRQLPRGGDHQVSIAIRAIRITGPHATAAVERTELDAKGRIVSSRQETYALEKQATGFVALRR